MSGRLALSLRLARRELRSGLGGFGVFMACLALGVAAVTAVGSLNEALEQGLRREARSLLGGDLEVRQSNRPIAPEALALLKQHGAVSLQARMRAMARAGERQGPAARTTLAELKAVDGLYPLTGHLRLEGGGRLEDALTPKNGELQAVAEARLAQRLGLAVGQSLRVGKAAFRLAAIIAEEPDKGSGLFNLGPRLMVRLDDLEATGLLVPGSVVSHAALVRIEDGSSAAAVEAELGRSFPEETGWRVRDFTQSAAGLKRTLDNMALSLSLIALSALLLGGIGAAQAVRNFLASRAESLSAMRALGAERGLLAAAGLWQVLALALAGSLPGAILGSALAAAGAGLVGKGLSLPVEPGLYPVPLLMGLAYGLLTATAFALPLVSSAAAAPASRLFRGYVEPGSSRPTALSLALAGAAMVGMAGLAWSQSPSWKPVALFAASIAATACLLALAQRLIRLTARSLPRPREPRLRLALGNLGRRGMGLGTALSSLGLGLTVLSALLLADSNMREQLERSIPEAAPSYFYMDIPQGVFEEFRQTVLSVPGVARFDSAPSIRGRVVRLDGKPAESVRPDPESAWVLRGDRGLSLAETPPGGSRIIAGLWWAPGYDGPPLVSVESEAARGLGLSVGGSVTVNVMGREITARIANVREVDWASLALNHVFVFSPNALRGAPLTHLATVYAAPGSEERLFDAVSQRFPDLAAVYVRDVLDDVRGIMGSIRLALAAATAVVLAAGVLVLSQALRAGLRARHRDAVIYKVLGATRADILWALALEFGLVGLVAALVAALAGTATAYAFVTRLTHLAWNFFPVPLLLCLGMGTLFSALLGLAGVRAALGRPAWPVLRNE